MSLGNEPKMGKNYWMAFGLSMLVILSYPHFIKWFYPTAFTPAAAPAEESMNAPGEASQAAAGQERTVASEAALSAAEGPFIQNAVKPTLVRFENHHYDVEFSTLGGSITRLYFKGEPGKESLTETLFYEGDRVLPGLFGLRLLHETQDLTQIGFKLTRKGKNDEMFEFAFEKPGEFRLIKRYVFDPAMPVIYLESELLNLSGREKHFPLELEFALSYQPGKADGGKTNAQDNHFVESVIRSDKVKTANIGKISKKGYAVSETIEWAGLMKKYYAVLIRPDWTAIAMEVREKNEQMFARLKMEPATLAAGQSDSRNFMIYAGPQAYEALKEFGFESLISRGKLGTFKLWILNSLRFFHQYTGNYGWAIIIVTMIIKLLFTPLTHMSFENMKKMQAIQPKMKSMQERYKKDPEKMNKEMMELYRRNKVNPMMGCLPMLLQIPIFISFYQGLAEAIELKGAPFLFWIQDLSQPDRLMTLPFSIPFLGDGLNILPILMIGSMVWQQKLTPTAGTSPEQAKLMNMMPIIFGVMFYAMPSGLVLYWFVNNVLSIAHQIFVKRIVVVLHHEDQG